MSGRGLGLGVVLGLLASCVFAPDLSRYPPCTPGGGCPEGWACLASENLCLPECGEKGPCVDGLPSIPPGDGGTGDAEPDGGGPGSDGGAEALALAPQAPPEAVETASFSHDFKARGGTPPYVFTLIGEPPPGLSLTGGGTLSGTPTRVGDVSFEIEVADQGTPVRRARLPFTVRVRALLRLAGPGILADFPGGKAYVEQLSATGGSGRYTFELEPGYTLPSGLVLKANGEVSGTSSATTGVTVLVRVTDDAASPQTVSRSVQLTPSSCSVAGLCLRTRAVPDAREGTPYGYTFLASNGTGTLTWKVESGTPPPGLSLNPTTGVLSGTPVGAGESSFRVTVTDVFDKPTGVDLRLRVF